MTASTLESSTSVALLFEENLLFTQDAILLAIFFFTRRYLELQVWAKAAWQARDVSGSAEPYCAGFAQRAGFGRSGLPVAGRWQTLLQALG